MRLRTLIMFALLAARQAAAQEQPAEKTPDATYEAEIIPVKTLSGDSFNRLAKLLSVFGAKYASDETLRTIVVYAPKDVVAQMRRVVAELDRPGSEAARGRNIEMNLTFLRASTKAPAQPESLPAELEAVARQLRAATQYKDIRIWETVPLHLQEGTNAEQTARLPLIPGASTPSTATILIRTEGVIRKESGTFVRFNWLKFNIRVPYSTSSTEFQFAEVGLNTSGDFKEGQKSVLGKLSGIDNETSVFVVIELKVLD